MSSDADVCEFDRGKPIGLPHVKGSLQTKSLFVFDEQEKSLVRRTYSVWNTCLREELDFTWIPKVIGTDALSRITGGGRLIWRLKGKPAYDHGSIYAEYAGEMKDGRPSGKGTYFDRAGFRYEGTWSAGLCEGSGRLQLPNGDEYRGSFCDGKAHGEGIYFRSDGEIYTGRFEYGLRSGTARITLTNGSSYPSRWVEGAEHSDSRALRVAQLGPAAGATDDLRLSVLVDTSPLKKGMVGYKSTNTTEGLIVQPADERLMALWKGATDIELTESDFDPERGGIFEWSLSWPVGKLPPVLLVLDSENGTSNPIRVVNAYLDVRKSSTDLEPLVVITYDYETGCPPLGIEPTFTINNFGWTPLQEASLSLAFTKPAESPARSEPVWFKQLGTIEASVTINVEEKLREGGVDVEALRRKGESNFSCMSRSEAQCWSELVGSSTIGRAAPYVTRQYGFYIVANLAGSLQYKWRDDTARVNARESPCTVRAVLGTLEHGVECEGGDIEPIRTAAPLALRLDETNYKVPFELQTSIAPGRVLRHSLPIRASKSSRHQFQIVVALADGRDIRSRLIDLLYFLPNLWGRKQ